MRTALLPTFAAAARRLSLTQAGEQLALTQSAVSRQVRALEESLGVRRFERRTRALALTREGQELLLAVEDALDRLVQATRRLRSQPDVRTVTLTTTPGFASLWLIPRLVRFTDAHPGIDVRTSASNQLVDIERSGSTVSSLRADCTSATTTSSSTPRSTARVSRWGSIPWCASSCAKADAERSISGA